MLDYETVIERHAEHSRYRRDKIARFKATSWLRFFRKATLFREAYPVADWPLNEMAIICACLFAIGIMAAGIYGA